MGKVQQTEKQVKNFFSFLLGKHNARNATIITTCLSMFSKVFGYARTLLVAYLFGATAFVDAYYVALGAVTFISSTMNATVETTILPSMIKNDDETARNVYGFFFIFFVLLFVALSIPMLTFPEYYIKFFARTLDITRIKYAASMVIWILPFAGANLLIGFFSVWAYYRNSFTFPSTILAFSNIIIIIILIILYPILNDYALPAFQSVGYVIFATLIFFILKDVPLYPKHKPSTKILKKSFSDMVLRLLAAGTGFLYILVDRYFAATLPVGNVAAISYANLLFNQPTGLTASAFSIYFVKANQALKTEKESYSLLFQTLLIGWTYFFPAAIALSIIARPTVTLLLGYGAFDENAVNLTYPCLAVLALGLPILIWNIIITKYIIAIGKMKIVVLWSYIGVLGNYLLDNLLVNPFGAPGLCMASIIMWHISTSFLLLFSCRPILIHLFYKALQQSIVVAIWGIPFFAASRSGSFYFIFLAASLLLFHYFFCEKFGLYSEIPDQWRPYTIVKTIIKRIMPYITN